MKVLADSLLIQENVPTELYREFMGDLSEEIERENKIINDLLSLVKMDKTASNMNIQSVSMNELVEKILKRLRPIATKQNVEVVYQSFRPVTAEIDEVKLSLAITNLVEDVYKRQVLMSRNQNGISRAYPAWCIKRPYFIRSMVFY